MSGKKDKEPAQHPPGAPPGAPPPGAAPMGWPAGPYMHPGYGYYPGWGAPPPSGPMPPMGPGMWMYPPYMMGAAPPPGSAPAPGSAPPGSAPTASPGMPPGMPMSGAPPGMPGMPGMPYYPYAAPGMYPGMYPPGAPPPGATAAPPPATGTAPAPHVMTKAEKEDALFGDLLAAAGVKPATASTTSTTGTASPTTAPKSGPKSSGSSHPEHGAFPGAAVRGVSPAPSSSPSAFPTSAPMTRSTSASVAAPSPAASFGPSSLTRSSSASVSAAGSLPFDPFASIAPPVGSVSSTVEPELSDDFGEFQGTEASTFPEAAPTEKTFSSAKSEHLYASSNSSTASVTSTLAPLSAAIPVPITPPVSPPLPPISSPPSVPSPEISMDSFEKQVASSFFESYPEFGTFQGTETAPESKAPDPKPSTTAPSSTSESSTIAKKVRVEKEVLDSIFSHLDEPAEAAISATDPTLSVELSEGAKLGAEPLEETKMSSDPAPVLKAPETTETPTDEENFGEFNSAEVEWSAFTEGVEKPDQSVLKDDESKSGLDGKEESKQPAENKSKPEATSGSSEFKVDEVQEDFAKFESGFEDEEVFTEFEAAPESAPAPISEMKSEDEIKEPEDFMFDPFGGLVLDESSKQTFNIFDMTQPMKPISPTKEADKKEESKLPAINLSPTASEEKVTSVPIEYIDDEQGLEQLLGKQEEEKGELDKPVEVSENALKERLEHLISSERYADALVCNQFLQLHERISQLKKQYAISIALAAEDDSKMDEALKLRDERKVAEQQLATGNEKLFVSFCKAKKTFLKFDEMLKLVDAARLEKFKSDCGGAPSSKVTISLQAAADHHSLCMTKLRKFVIYFPQEWPFYARSWKTISSTLSKSFEVCLDKLRSFVFLVSNDIHKVNDAKLQVYLKGITEQHRILRRLLHSARLQKKENTLTMKSLLQTKDTWSQILSFLKKSKEFINHVKVDVSYILESDSESKILVKPAYKETCTVCLLPCANPGEESSLDLSTVKVSDDKIGHTTCINLWYHDICCKPEIPAQINKFVVGL